MTLLRDEHEAGRTRQRGILHDLRATPKTVHWGYFDAALAPVLTVASGDVVRAEAITHHAGDAPELMMDAGITAIFEGIPPEDRNPGVHIMTGPIYVEDARPGDMLEVRYLQMTPRLRYGSNLAANWGYLYHEFGEKERVTIYRMDPASQTAEAVFAYDFPGKYLVPGTVTREPDCCRQPALRGVRVPVRPHLGTAGVAPDAPGRVSTIPPGRHGGNIDNWRIGAGATMFYPGAGRGRPVLDRRPAHLPGRRRDQRHRHRGLARRAVPDLHPPRLQLSFAAVAHADSFMTHGFDEDLNQAMRNASLEMLRLLTEHHGLSKRRRLFADERRRGLRRYPGG